jgi:hypothetical protein
MQAIYSSKIDVSRADYFGFERVRIDNVVPFAAKRKADSINSDIVRAPVAQLFA